MQKTTNYQLNQWDKTDRIQMEDFNADNAKIEAALAGMPRIVTGSYHGNNSTTTPLVISLGFYPTAVFIVGTGTKFSNAAILLTRANNPFKVNDTTLAQLDEGGFRVWASNLTPYLNSDTTYTYIAIG